MEWQIGNGFPCGEKLCLAPARSQLLSIKTGRAFLCWEWNPMPTSVYFHQMEMLITKPQQIHVQMHYQVYTNNSFILSDRWKKTFTAFLGDIRKSFKAVQCILNPNPKRNQLYPIIVWDSSGTSRSDSKTILDLHFFPQLIVLLCKYIFTF